MTRRKRFNENIRNIQKSRSTYYVNIPIELMREFGWRERQRVTVTKYGDGILIKDYDPKKR